VEAGSDVVNQPMSAPAENQLGDLFYSAGAVCWKWPNFDAMECGSPLYLSGERSGGMLDRYGLRDDIPDFYFAVAEKAGTGRSNRFVDYHIFALDGSATGNPADATFSFDSSESITGFRLTSSRGELLYGHAAPNTVASWPYTNEYYGGDPVVVGPVSGGVEFVEEGYVSERGSVVGRVGSSSVEFLIAERVAKGRWVIRSGSDSGE